VALTPHARVARQVEFNWGVTGLVCPPVSSPEDMVEKALKVSREAGFVQSGEKIVVIAGIPFGIKGSTNMLRVVEA
jgi:pyruvate kinase